MGVDTLGAEACLNRVEAAAAVEPAPAWDRFAHWPRQQALALIVAILAVIVAAALVPITVGRGAIATPPPIAGAFGARTGARERPRDDDLKLYDAAIARIQRGENYYSFIAQEHRKASYPLRPGLAVRLPTLAYLDAWLGLPGQIAAAFALMAGVLWAWWRRMGDEPGGLEHRNIAVALMFMGASLGLNRYYFVLHELWAGMLIALAFGLHRPSEAGCARPTRAPAAQTANRWYAAWVAVALALAIREHTLPFVLLLAAYAGWRRQWREMAAWIGLIALFAVGLAIHLHLVALHTLPSDPTGPSWFALRGLGGWLSDIALSSNLRFLPHWLAGPAILLMILGWAGWKSPAGSFATLLYLGYGALFMIAGRDDNFYWGATIAPAMFIGLAFVPMALQGLATAAVGRSQNA